VSYPVLHLAGGITSTLSVKLATLGNNPAIPAGIAVNKDAEQARNGRTHRTSLHFPHWDMENPGAAVYSFRQARQAAEGPLLILSGLGMLAVTTGRLGLEVIFSL
jgi:hypothetical protein